MIAAASLTDRAAEELSVWNVPGLELAAVKDGEVVLAEGVGLRNVEDNLPATPETLFHHGSTGKAFTGVLVGTLVDAGLLDWDRPVRDYLPDFRMNNPLLTERVTIADLLSHRSGMVRHDFLWLANPSLSRGELAARLRYLESPLDFRTTFSYSNLAYATVGHLVAVVTGSTWEEQMRLRVLEPLGMNRTVNSVNLAQEMEDHAQPYVVRDGQFQPIPWRQSDQIAPAGQMITCARDITHWLRFQLSDGEIDGTRILAPETLARTKTPSTPFEQPGPDPDIRFYGYGFGWGVGTYRGRRLVWHNGGIDGFKTEIALLPDDGIGVAVSCNVLNTNLPFSLAFQTVDTLLGAEEKPWTENLRKQEAEMPRPEPPTVVPGTHPSHALSDYAGEYEHPGYGTLSVTVEGPDLRVRIGEMDVDATYRHYDTWSLRYEPLDADWSLTFLTNPEGRISAAETPLEPQANPIRFERKPEGT